MKGSVEVGRALIKSYQMMLDFYGMVLVDQASGAVRFPPVSRNFSTWQ